MSLNTRRILRALVLLAPLGLACQCEPKTPPKATERPKEIAKPAEVPTGQPVTGLPTEIPPPPDVSAPPPDAEMTASGIASKVIVPGTGTVHPKPADTISVHYTGWTAADGKMFDSSKTRGAPLEAMLQRLIPGWIEAIPLMVTGETRRLWIPAKMAYEGRPGPQGMLVFEVELVAITEAPKPLPAPPDVAAPPADAKKTKSKLAYKILKRGAGSARPTADDMVKVHYTGWTTDGKMFDSSHMRGRPAEFPLKGVIPGWTEGVPLMQEGDTARFWIPVELAYQGRPGAPAGMLVFDIDLLEIRKAPPR